MFTGGSYTNPGELGPGPAADSALGRSAGRGRTWERLTGGLPEHIDGNVEAMSLHAWPGGVSVFAGTTDGEVFYSDDAGDNWAALGGLPPISKTTHYPASAASSAAGRWPRGKRGAPSPRDAP